MTKRSGRGRLLSDATAGLINAVVSVPDGLASAALAGVNPVYGLYTSVAASITGSLLVSTQLMQTATTSASALAAGQAISSYPADQRDEALFLLVVLSGVMLVVFGVLRLGRLVRFVSHSVMTGFLIGVAAVLILDQLAPLVGFEPEGGNEIVQFVDLVTNSDNFNGPTIIIGVLALAISFGLERTRFGTISSLAALVVPTMLVALVGWDSVQLVSDVSSIPRGIPTPGLPNISLVTVDLLFSAVAVAVVIAVQGVGVSQSVENPDDSPNSPSRDMVAQGAANIAAGLLSGIPAGGSVGQTALNVNVGARSRWAGVFGGIWMLAFLVIAPDLVGRVPMAVLAALMILAGISAINLQEAVSIWKTGGPARWTILATFLATLVLSVQVAVAVGVVLAIILYTASSASDVVVRELVPLDDGRWAETEPPKSLRSRDVVVLDVEGSLFFAGARTLEHALPSPRETERPAVVLRLRGRTRVGATLIEVLETYAEDLAEVDGRIFLSGVHEAVIGQLRRAGKLDPGKALELLPATEIIGESTEDAVEAARTWLNHEVQRPATSVRSRPVTSRRKGEEHAGHRAGRPHHRSRG